jgi:2-oxoglutarate ferredoxin oxidoreductase subunit alpha
VHRYNVTGLFHDMWGFPSENPVVVYELLRHLVDKIENHVNEVTRYREYFVDDAEILLISYGSSARSALHVVADRRKHGERIGLLELQTLWPFPSALVREKARNARYVVVVEMNMGQVMQSVRASVEKPERVFLSNRVDGVLITPVDIRNILRLIQGKGV